MATGPRDREAEEEAERVQQLAEAIFRNWDRWNDEFADLSIGTLFSHPESSYAQLVPQINSIWTRGEDRDQAIEKVDAACRLALADRVHYPGFPSRAEVNERLMRELRGAKMQEDRKLLEQRSNPIAAILMGLLTLGVVGLAVVWVLALLINR